MKNILKNIYLILIALVSFSACDTDAEYVTYEGPGYIMFSDTLYSLPVQNNEEYFKLPVVATRACDYDRVLAVEVVDSVSNASEGRHYSLKSNTVVIPAGRLVGNVEVRGYHDNIAVGDSLGFSLRLVSKEHTQWDMYGIETKVALQKACKFDVNAFAGFCVVTSQFFYEFTNYENRLAYIEVDGEEENTIVVKDYFYDGYDVKIKFQSDDLLNPLIEFDEQKFGPTDEAFGTKYGKDGIINLYQPSMYPSYFSSCEKFIVQYITLYVPSMAGMNVVGSFVNVVEMISEDEAKKLMNEGGYVGKTAKNKLGRE